TFDVRRGETFAFLGRNGAGKTTTIKMLTTVLRPTSGTLELDGLDPVTQATEVRKRLGVVFQDPSLDSELTAWENVDLHGVLYHVPRRVRRDRGEALLRLFELWDRRNDLVKTFSGGMRRRLEIARGLLHTPKVLFLDEPTLGLDPQSRNQMWTIVKNLNATVRAIREEIAVGVVYILWLRELKKYLRSRVQIVASLGAPLMYLGVLGFGLGPVFRRAGEGSYLQFMAPGVIGMTVLFTAMFSGIAMLWDRQFGFLKETLVAPVPRVQIMIGRTLGGATVAVLQGLLIFAATLVAGFRPVSLLAIPAAFLVIALIAIVFAALATAIGSTLKEMQGFQMVMNFFVMRL